MSTQTTDQADTQQSKTAGKYLTFKLGDESYGIGVLQVREIIRLQTITPMPQMPIFVKGVINLRGKVISVISLRQKFALAEGEANEQNCIIVVEAVTPGGKNLLMGIIVDAVEEVAQIGESDIEPAPDFGMTIDTNYMRGMAKIKGEVKTLLDINRVIGGDNINQIASVS